MNTLLTGSQDGSDFALLAETYPPPTRGTVVVWGLLAAYPFGGMAWQVLHYIAALRRLGFDVWYVEDSDRYVFDPFTYCLTPEYAANVQYLTRFMNVMGMNNRWIFRPPADADPLVGARDAKGLDRLYRDADAVFNICAAQELRPEHDAIRCLVWVETDPVANQVAVASGDLKMRETLDAYHYLFSYGENFGASDCRVPLDRYQWISTRPPVHVEWWQRESEQQPLNPHFTTVANWKHSGKDIEWQGETWRWSKDHEFRKLINLPKRTSLPLEMAVGAIEDEDEQALRDNGWLITRSENLVDPLQYYRYIRGSMAELTVAKEQYVAPRSGWFSDRSVCYLAAGRPVIMQSTGFENIIPTGNGLFWFTDGDSAIAAMEMVMADYPRHSKAALEIATEYFGAERVVGDMLRKIGLL